MAVKRLATEEKMMLSLAREGRITIAGEGGRPFRKYKVGVTVPSFIKGSFVSSPGPHIFTVSAPAGYPITDSPVVSFVSGPVAHVNIHKNGNVCIGRFGAADTLASITIRTIRLILLDPETFNFASMADSDCEDFCRNLPKRESSLNFQIPAPVI